MELLDDQFKLLDSNDLATLNVGAGTIKVFTDEKKWVKFRLSKLVIMIIKYAYQRGLDHKALF